MNYPLILKIVEKFIKNNKNKLLIIQNIIEEISNDKKF